MSDRARVAVFIDHQNTYMRARECFFHEGDPHILGQYKPLLLGKALCPDSDPDRVLTHVRVYCGMPSNEKDRKGYSARRRQITMWSGDAPTVQTFARPLRYPPNYPSESAQEKGVDVALAVDCVRMAVKGEYDVGILVSEDTDLRPVLEAILDLDRGPTIEVASWQPLYERPRFLTIPDRYVKVHLLDRRTYDAVADQKDYAAPLPQIHLPGRSAPKSNL